MTEQWQELKETITEMRDNGGTGTQQEVCKFLTNYMEILEKQMQQPCDDCISRKQALKETKALIRGDYDPEYIIETLKMLPSVTPKAEQKAVLDKIRAEIEQITDTMGVSYNQYVSKIDVLQILDKYKAEPKIEQGLNFADQDTMIPAT